MRKNTVYLIGLLVLVLFGSSCKKDKEGSGLKAVFSYVADGYKVNFTNFSMNATEYSWDFGDQSGETSTSRSPQHIFTKKGDFLVSLIAKNGTETSTFIDTVSVIGPNIRIDGDFTDWQYVEFTHQNAAGYPGTLLGVKTFASSDMINFYIEGTSGMNMEIFDMYIDADNDPATGFSTWLYPAGSGANYLCEGSLIGGWGDVFIHTGPPSGFTFSPVASFGEVMTFSAVVTNGSKKGVEFSIKKSILGTTRNFVNFAFIELNGGWADIGRLPESQTPESKFIAIPL